MGKGLYHAGRRLRECVRQRKQTQQNAHSIILAKPGARVKNGSCQERRRQERGAITRGSERGRRRRRREMIERLEIHERSLIEMRDGGRE